MAKNEYRVNDKFFVSELKVLVYVIGYQCYGESNIVLIMNRDEVIYSIVIDSFHYKPYDGSPFINKAVDILRQHHVSHLDVLCWTHPHDDHSKGITTIIKKFCDEDTYVLYPNYIESNTSDIVKLKNVSKTTVEKILEVNKEGKICACPIGVIKERHNNVDDFKIVGLYDDEDVRKVSIDVITPISNMLTRYVNSDKCDDPNELSITLVINIDNFGFYFGGDTTNAHIDASNKEMISRCRFIKIPHHASTTADHLPKYLNKDNLSAVCTSVFEWGRSHNPNKKVIWNYQKFFKDIYSTNKHLKKEGHGVLLYEYDFSKGYPVCDIHPDGNVGKLNLIKKDN